MQYNTSSTISVGFRAVMSAGTSVQTVDCKLQETQAAWQLLYQFRRSDSRVVTRMLIQLTPSPGSNSKNTYRVEMGTSPRFNEADGAGAMRTKRSRVAVSEYFRVTGGVS